MYANLQEFDILLLSGKVLRCHCACGQRCHGDVLIALWEWYVHESGIEINPPPPHPVRLVARIHVKNKSVPSGVGEEVGDDREGAVRDRDLGADQPVRRVVLRSLPRKGSQADPAPSGFDGHACLSSRPSVPPGPVLPCPIEALTNRLRAAKPVAWRQPGELCQLAWEPVRRDLLVLLDLGLDCGGRVLSFLGLGLRCIVVAIRADAGLRHDYARNLVDAILIDSLDIFQEQVLSPLQERRGARLLLVIGEGGRLLCQQ